METLVVDQAYLEITILILKCNKKNLCEMHRFVLYKLLVICGEDRIRTDDLLTASQAL